MYCGSYFLSDLFIMQNLEHLFSLRMSALADNSKHEAAAMLQGTVTDERPE